MAAPLPKDQQFSAEYGQRASIKPSAGGIRNAQKTYKTNVANDNQSQINNSRNVVTFPKTNTALSQRAQSAQQSVSQVRVENKPAPANDNKATPAQTEKIPARKPISRFVQRQYTRAKINTKKKPGTIRDLRQRAKATAVNTGLLSWNIPLWAVFQLPMALLHLVLTALAIAESMILGGLEDVAEVRDDDGVLVSAAKTIFRWGKKTIEVVAGRINDAISQVTGFDIASFIGQFAPSALAGDFMVIMAVYGMALLLIIGIVYLLAGLNPLFGRGAGAKISALLVAIIGYSFPFTNLFPWFIFWIAVVWRYPK